MPSWVGPGYRADRFIGRERELERLAALHARGERLITLVGPPGMGKTRLLIEYLRTIQPPTETAVCFCDLSEARDDGDLRAAMTRALGLNLDPAGSQDGGALVRALRADPLLLGLDNLEQIAPLAARRIAEWLHECPSLTILATSRERLRIAGEAGVEVGPLALPGATVSGVPDAVALLVDRARARAPELDVTAENGPLLYQIAGLLGGIPLAIELAAARVGILGLEELAQRLAQSLDVVSRGDRLSTSRHQSLRAAVRWSWELLDDAERRALSRCAVFRGGFDLRAAEAVLSDLAAPSLELVHSLCDKSLVRHEARSGGPTRFALYYGVREFAEERLRASGEENEARARHAAHYVDVGAESAEEVERTGSSGVRRLLVQERDNLLAAHEWLWMRGACADASLGPVLDALEALEPIFTVHGPVDSFVRLLDDFFRHPGASALSPQLRGRALRVRSRALQLSGALPGALPGGTDSAEHDIEAAVSLLSGAGDVRWLAPAVADSGVLHHHRRNLELARRRYEWALSLYEQLGSKRQEARLLGNVGALHHDLRDFEMAEAYYVRALELLKRLAEPAFEGNVLTNLGVLAHEQERHEQAADYFERAEAVLHRAEDRRLLGIAHGNWGALEHERGRVDIALQLLTAALHELEAFGDAPSLALCLARRGAVNAAEEAHAASQVDIDRAERLVSADEEPLIWTAIQLYDAFRKLRAESPPSGEAIRVARVRVQRARQPIRDGMSSPEHLSDDVRSAIRLIEREVRRAEPLAPLLEGVPRDALVIGPGAIWFRAPGGVSQRLSQNGAVRRILLALVEAHEAAARDGLDLNALRDAGWPGEKMTADAASNRVHVALAELRRKGLKSYMVRSPSGTYSLEARVRVQRVEGE